MQYLSPEVYFTAQLQLKKWSHCWLDFQPNGVQKKNASFLTDIRPQKGAGDKAKMEKRRGKEKIKKVKRNKMWCFGLFSQDP